MQSPDPKNEESFSLSQGDAIQDLETVVDDEDNNSDTTNKIN
jgi:hypothetical protein